MRTTLCMLGVNVWSGLAFVHASVFVCFSDIDPCDGTKGVYQSQQNLPCCTNPPVNHSASPSSAHDRGPPAASIYFSPWSRETPSLTNTKTCAVSLHLFPSQKSRSLCPHLLPPYICHHIQTVRKSSAVFDFFPFSSSTCYLSVLCASSLCQCRHPPILRPPVTILPPFTLDRVHDFVV